ncbi:MAG: DUF427 domain-containing protein, partial [Woeseia sp.]
RDTVTDFTYKGPSQHWHLGVRGESIEDAAWSLCDPIGEAHRIGDAVCFYPDKVETEVDGETAT